MIEYKNHAWLIALAVPLQGSVALRALCMALPSALLCVLMMSLNDAYPGFRETWASEELTGSQLWSCMAATVTFAIGFRTNKAYTRFWEGSTLLHQIRGEWFDAVSCLVAFSSLAKEKKHAEVMDFRHALVRLMSLCHGSALDEIQGSRIDCSFDYIDLGGLDQQTLRYLKLCKDELQFNRVEVLIHMIQQLIVDAQDRGVIKIAPPILSRVFQTLSRGQVNLMNCKKIKDCLFPYPYVQMTSVLLLTLSFLTPMVVSGLVTQYHWGFIFTALPLFGLCCLNYTAVQLELPFGLDHNDLPLKLFQEEMNRSLIMLMRDETDQVARTSKGCVMDYQGMISRVDSKRVRAFLSDSLQDNDPGISATAIRIGLEKESGPSSQSARLGGSPLALSAPVMPDIKPSGLPLAAAPALPSPWPPDANVSGLEAAVKYHADNTVKLSESFQLLVRHTDTLSVLLNANTEVMRNLCRDLPNFTQPSWVDPLSPSQVPHVSRPQPSAGVGGPMTTSKTRRDG
eukprot:TRINITY_DN105567_c0_g1_i1.p1 TRINITY_DN105567_c0_g1~~TRINITY_DN105567_c0_g1_i1.p1  ORF type:complete len:512 (-),score=90.07 TRINITY_DN105567_c0_g1_i1:263-1798(-)